MTIQCVLDLETLGTNFDTAILSIGAVMFDDEKLEVTSRFYNNVDIQSCLDIGMTVSGHTIAWWLKQSNKARESLEEDRIPIFSALSNLTHWVSNRPFAGIWTNGADFDLPIIATAYNKCRLTYPLSHRQHRCYRTLRALYDVKVESNSIKHNALDDAVHQAEVMMAIIKKYSVKL